MITVEDQQTRLSRKGLNAVRELRKLNAQIDELKERAKRHRGVLELELGEPEAGTKRVGVDGHGHPLCERSISIRQNVSLTLLRKSVPADVVASCTVETPVKGFKLLGE